MLEMSTVCRFPLITENEFFHNCQPGVGRWSKTAKILPALSTNAPKSQDEFSLADRRDLAALSTKSQFNLEMID